jgi:hypothetical protein
MPLCTHGYIKQFVGFITVVLAFIEIFNLFSVPFKVLHLSCIYNRT